MKEKKVFTERKGAERGENKTSCCKWEILTYTGASLVAQTVKNLPAMRDTWV